MIFILVPKILKNINNDNISLNNLGAIKPDTLRWYYKSKNMFTFQDNTNDEIDHAVRNFLNSLFKKMEKLWKKFSIQQKNYDFLVYQKV